MAMSSGINFHGFGNFIIPLSKEFGWSRTTVSAVFSLARLEAGFIGPAEGWAVDRMGPRKLMFSLGNSFGRFLLECPSGQKPTLVFFVSF